MGICGSRITNMELVAKPRKQMSSFPFWVKMKRVLSVHFLELEAHEQLLCLRTGARALTSQNRKFLFPYFVVSLLQFIPFLL